MRAALRASSDPGCSVAVKVVLGIAALGIAAAIAIPNLMRAKVQWYDTAAIAALRNLASCQANFMTWCHVDLDGDRNGEFGTIGEMTAVSGVRRDAEGRERGPRIAVPILSPAFKGVGPEGIAFRLGYCFRVLLPARGGGATREGSPDQPLLAPVDVDAAEKRWCAYAWPNGKWGTVEDRARDHCGAFYIDECGDVWTTPNKDLRYSGPDGGPAWDAAMPPYGWGRDWTSPNAVEYLGRDGNVWRITN